MHKDQIQLWQHDHVFNIEKKNIEKRTFIVVIITLFTMVAEIFFGWFTNSMALLADGWHMGTHAFALGISLMAYVMARKYSRDETFSFGAWKIEILGAYSSAIVLGLVGLIMIYTSVQRIINPLTIQYNQALLAAILGLVVNVICAVILNEKSHIHEHEYEQNHHHVKDLNQKSAYLHVVADALTSFLAIAALLCVKYFSITWIDPFMGIIGAGLILHWSAHLLKDTSRILLQREMDLPVSEEIKKRIESDGDSKVCDFHIWQIAQNRYACIVSLVTEKEYSIEEYKKRLGNIHELAHVTIEIYRCKKSCSRNER